MSNAKLSRLELLVEVLERRLDLTPNIAVLRERADGTVNAERFTRDYGMTPEQIEARGGTVVVRTNFKRKDLPVAHGPFKTDMQSVSDPYGIKGIRS
jgi:hypothetical protein